MSLAAGQEHTCAVLSDDSLRCWGSAKSGQLGSGDTETIGDDETPESVSSVDLGPAQTVEVFAGPLALSTCALLDDESLRCWGDNWAGQLGQGHTGTLGDELTQRPGDLHDILILDDDDSVRQTPKW